MAYSFKASTYDVPVRTEQRISIEVRMVRPDRKRPVIRRFFDTKIPTAHSLAQLGGFLNHKLFGDTERGGAGTVYHYTIRMDGDVDGFTLTRTPQGRYIQV